MRKYFDLGKHLREKFRDKVISRASKSISPDIGNDRLKDVDKRMSVLNDRILFGSETLRVFDYNRLRRMLFRLLIPSRILVIAVITDFVFQLRKWRFWRLWSLIG